MIRPLKASVSLSTFSKKYVIYLYNDSYEIDCEFMFFCLK